MTNLTLEQEAPSKVFTASPELVGVILEGAKEAPEADFTLLLFMATRYTFLNNILKDHVTNPVDVIFVYYLAAYKEYFKQETGPTEEYMLYNHAALSLITLYLSWTNNLILRGLAKKAVEAIGDIILEKYTSDENIDPKEIVPILTQLSCLTISADKYLKPRLVSRNTAYINWLVSLLRSLLMMNCIDYLKTDDTFQSAVTQVQKNVRIIKLL